MDKKTKINHLINKLAKHILGKKAYLQYEWIVTNHPDDWSISPNNKDSITIKLRELTKEFFVNSVQKDVPDITYINNKDFLELRRLVEDTYLSLSNKEPSESSLLEIENNNNFFKKSKQVDNIINLENYKVKDKDNNEKTTLKVSDNLFIYEFIDFLKSTGEVMTEEDEKMFIQSAIDYIDQFKLIESVINETPKKGDNNYTGVGKRLKKDILLNREINLYNFFNQIKDFQEELIESGIACLEHISDDGTIILVNNYDQSVLPTIMLFEGHTVSIPVKIDKDYDIDYLLSEEFVDEIRERHDCNCLSGENRGVRLNLYSSSQQKFIGDLLIIFNNEREITDIVFFDEDSGDSWVN